MYERTGIPGRELCKSITFDEEVEEDLKLNYIFNVLDPISDPEEIDDDVVIEESRLAKAANLLEKEIDNCDDLIEAQKRVRVIEDRLFGRMQRLVNDAEDTRDDERVMRRSLLETLLSAKSKGQKARASYIS